MMGEREHRRLQLKYEVRRQEEAFMKLRMLFEREKERENEKE